MMTAFAQALPCFKALCFGKAITACCRTYTRKPDRDSATPRSNFFLFSLSVPACMYLFFFYNAITANIAFSSTRIFPYQMQPPPPQLTVDGTPSCPQPHILALHKAAN